MPQRNVHFIVAEGPAPLYARAEEVVGLEAEGQRAGERIPPRRQLQRPSHIAGLEPRIRSKGRIQVIESEPVLDHDALMALMAEIASVQGRIMAAHSNPAGTEELASLVMQESALKQRMYEESLYM